LISKGLNLKNCKPSDFLTSNHRWDGDAPSAIRRGGGRCNAHAVWTFIFIAFAFCWQTRNATEVIASSPTPATAPAIASDDALGGHKYPWYDPETRAVKPLQPQVGNGPFSTDRETVPVAKPKPVTANTNTTTNTGGGLGGFGGPTTPSNFAGPLNSIGLTIIILAIVVLLVITFLRLEAFKYDVNIDEGRSRQESIEQLPFELEDSDGDFQSAAEAAYRRGDLRLAIVYLYSHVLVTLDQNRIIRLRKGKTNRQYLSEVRSRRGIASYFRQVMLPFESVFFGDHDMDADEFAKCWDGLNQFHSNIKDDSGVLIG